MNQTPAPGPDPARGAGHTLSSLLAAGVILMSCLLAASLALLPALLIGFVLLLRDVLGPTALPFGLVASVLSWLAPDWGARAVAVQAMLRGFDAGLAARLVPPLAVAACALAPAAATILQRPGWSRTATLLLRIAALAAGGVAMRLGGGLVTLCLLPGLCVFAWQAAAASDSTATDLPDQPSGR
ncbi:putative membrane protein [Endobacter medicaginis]|uniref:Putative membrane protein n=3 Tax=Endobacter medicaginis TaxID=1181271 RepID=A0A839V299_9PROT|nr:hypothetical protein [Endobacter medicaginis]MBB3174610.1 putative membrane protein [Endobacter medicaginis]MCX5474698.1 hypothetical protein [Endobacter medicaginis]